MNSIRSRVFLSKYVNIGILTTVLCTAAKTYSFFPTRWHTVAGALGQSHTQITDDAIEELDSEFFGITHLTTPMKDARSAISDANAAVDQDQHTAFKHFDGESFPEGQALLVGLFQGVISDLQADHAGPARTKLGQ